MSSSQVELGWVSGDRPGALTFAWPVPAEAAQAITRALAPYLCARRIGALETVSGPVGRFRLVDDAERSWFVRVTRRWTDVEREKDLLDHLDRTGVAVNPMRIAGLKLRWNDEDLRIDVRPFIAGAHFSGTETELVSLGRTLADCHAALANYPGSAAIRAAAVRRAERLEAMRRSLRDMLAAGKFAALGDAASWARANKRWLQALVEGFDPRMPDQPRAQCVHGEVHGGNVLFADNRAVLLDFEEATHVFAPPAWDLAYAVQRFCLAGAPTLEVAAVRAASLARGYGELPPLADAMKQVAWYMAAVALATWTDQGLATPASEFVKFTRLTSEVDRFHSVAEGIRE